MGSRCAQCRVRPRGRPPGLGGPVCGCVPGQSQEPPPPRPHARRGRGCLTLDALLFLSPQMSLQGPPTTGRCPCCHRCEVASACLSPSTWSCTGCRTRPSCDSLPGPGPSRSRGVSQAVTSWLHPFSPHRCPPGPSLGPDGGVSTAAGGPRRPVLVMADALPRDEARVPVPCSSK